MINKFVKIIFVLAVLNFSFNVYADTVTITDGFIKYANMLPDGTGKMTIGFRYYSHVIPYIDTFVVGKPPEGGTVSNNVNLHRYDQDYMLYMIEVGGPRNPQIDPFTITIT